MGEAVDRGLTPFLPERDRDVVEVHRPKRRTMTTSWGDGASGSLRCLSTLPGFMMAIGDIRRGELRLKTGPPPSVEAHGRGSKRPGCFAPADPI